MILFPCFRTCCLLYHFLASQRIHCTRKSNRTINASLMKGTGGERSHQEKHTHIPRTLSQVVHFLCHRKREQTAGFTQGASADETAQEGKHRSPHSPDCCYHQFVCDTLNTETHSNREMLRKSGSLQKPNSAKKSFGSFMLCLGLHCSIVHIRLYVRLSLVLIVVPTRIQNPEGGMNV